MNAPKDWVISLRLMTKASLMDPDDMARVAKTLQAHQYEFQKQIGEGGYGSVYLVRSDKYHELFVAKRIPVKGSQRVISEVEVLLSLHHPNIINMYEYWYDEDDLYIILEYCVHGSLRDLIKSCGPLSQKHLWQACKEIATAIEFCHARNIVHRDIKPANLLIDKYNRVKLADFGLSAPSDALVNSHVGSPAYMAPETFTRGAHIDQFKCDVWALGVTMFELATGVLPWSSRTFQEMKHEIRYGLQKRPRVPDHSFSKLLRQLMDVNPALRPTMAEVLKSEYFQGDGKSNDSLKRMIRQADPRVRSTPKLTTGYRGATKLNPPTSGLFAGQIGLVEARSIKGSVSFTLLRPNHCGVFRSSKNLHIIAPQIVNRSAPHSDDL